MAWTTAKRKLWELGHRPLKQDGFEVIVAKAGAKEDDDQFHEESMGFLRYTRRTRGKRKAGCAEPYQCICYGARVSAAVDSLRSECGTKGQSTYARAFKAVEALKAAHPEGVTVWLAESGILTVQEQETLVFLFQHVAAWVGLPMRMVFVVNPVWSKKADAHGRHYSWPTWSARVKFESLALERSTLANRQLELSDEDDGEESGLRMVAAG